MCVREGEGEEKERERQGGEDTRGDRRARRNGIATENCQHTFNVLQVAHRALIKRKDGHTAA
jgi:hypothetical protein